MRRIVLLLILPLIAVLPTRAADGPAETVAPFLDEQTFAVVCIDFTRIDAKAVFDRLRKELPSDKDDPVAAMLTGQLSVGETVLANVVKQFTAAGGKELYLVVTLADDMTMPIFALVSLKDPKAGPDAMIDLIQGRPAEGHLPRNPMKPSPLPFKPEVVEPVGRLIFAGSKQALARAKAGKPDARPELTKAFASVGDAAVEAAFIPTVDSRRVIKETLPTLPEEIGGGPSTALTDGLRWAAVGFDPPPKMALKLRIGSKDADSARAVQAMIQKGFDLVGKQPEVRKFMPKFEAQSRRLLPKVAGNGLELTLDTQQIGSLLTDVLTPALAEARRQARRTMAASQLRMIGIAVFQYAAQHKRLPDTLEAMVQAKMLDAKALSNPRDPKRTPGFVYRKPATTMRDLDRPAAQVMAYEAHDDWPIGGIAVLCADGHVELIADQARFKKRLAESGKAVKKNE